MKAKWFAWMIVPALALGTAGCTVEQTEEGELPRVEVEGGNLPEYDVDTAEVEIRGEKKTIEVPDIDIDTEEKEIIVPDVDIQSPAEADRD